MYILMAQLNCERLWEEMVAILAEGKGGNGIGMEKWGLEEAQSEQGLRGEKKEALSPPVLLPLCVRVDPTIGVHASPCT